MKKIFTLLLLVMFVSHNLMAVEGDGAKINEVKRDASYLYSEATMAEGSEAKVLALNLLEANIKTFLEERGKDNIYDALYIASRVQYYETMRGTMHRVFAYIPKSEFEASQEAELPAPISDEQTVDVEPVAGPMPDLAPEPQEPQNIVEPELEPKPAVPVIENTPSVTSNAAFEYSATLDVVSSIANFEDVGPLFKSCEKIGRITKYGKYQVDCSYPNAALLIYDQNGFIRALLTPEKNGQRVNVKTKSVDSVTNYKGCGAIWFEYVN